MKLNSPATVTISRYSHITGHLHSSQNHYHHSVSFKCVTMWTFNVLFWANPLPHFWHKNGFSPVCVRIWFSRWSLRPNILSHSTQQCLVSFLPSVNIKRNRAEFQVQNYEFTLLLASMHLFVNGFGWDFFFIDQNILYIIILLVCKAFLTQSQPCHINDKLQFYNKFYQLYMISEYLDQIGNL